LNLIRIYEDQGIARKDQWETFTVEREELQQMLADLGLPELTFQNWDLTDPEQEKSNNGKAKGKNETHPGNGNGKPEQANEGNGKSNGNAKGQTKQDCEKQAASNGTQKGANKGSNKGANENAINNGNGNKFGLLKQLENDEGALGKPNLEQTRYLYEGLSTVLHKEYSEKGSPYAEYYTGPNSEVVSRKMFGLHGLVNPGHEDTLDTNGGLMYYQYNGRHTVSELTDRHGSMIESYRYDAFGSMYSGIAAPYNTASYTGHHFDNMTGLMDMKARWYDPTSARFLTEDTWAGSLTQPYTQNRYAYVGNNPVNMWDPTGNVPEPTNVPSWVKAQSNYTVSESYVEEYYDYEIYGKEANEVFHYSEYRKKWYEFKNYSESWGDSQYVGRQAYGTYYEDNYEQMYYETWNYTYHDEYVFIHDWLGGIDRDNTTETTFTNSDRYTWENRIYYKDLNDQNQEEIANQYESPPAHASKESTFSVDGVEYFQTSSMNGVTTSANVLIDENQYKIMSNAQQQILHGAVEAFIGGEISTPQSSVKGQVQIASIGGDIVDYVKEKAYLTKGIWTGLENSALSAWEIIRHPIDTAKVIDEVVESLYMFAITGDSDHIEPIMMAFGESVVQEITRYIEGNRYERAEQEGEIFGGVLGGLILAKGVGAVLKLIKKAKILNNVPGNALVKDTGKLADNTANLRSWAEKNGWEQQYTAGGVEQWGVRNTEGTFSWRLKLKPEASTREGLGAGSNQPRFDARLDDKGTYVNPFTGETGGKSVGTHIPLGK
jgi:RHS repeat-associated protein